MNFSLAVKTCLLKDCFTMNRRAARSEYWWFMLFGFVAGLVLGVLNLIPIIGTIIWVIGGLWIWIASLTVSVRRLHDGNHTGWWLVFPYLWCILGGILIFVTFGSAILSGNGDPSTLLATLGVLGCASLFIGSISFLLLIIYFILPGTKGENRFGQDPLVD